MQLQAMIFVYHAKFFFTAPIFKGQSFVRHGGLIKSAFLPPSADALIA
ncbi:hypothetical protein HNP69_001720 [Chryseobacterium koreense]|nr:hypothetical protein [Chryseobacterium koreense]